MILTQSLIPSQNSVILAITTQRIRPSLRVLVFKATVGRLSESRSKRHKSVNFTVSISSSILSFYICDKVAKFLEVSEKYCHLVVQKAFLVTLVGRCFFTMLAYLNRF